MTKASVLRALVAIAMTCFAAACATAQVPFGGPFATASQPSAAPAPHATPGALRVVLVAGDNSIANFDNATNRFAADLVQRAGLRPDAIERLSARQDQVARGADAATRSNVVAAIAQMQAGPGDACLVYATSHGAHGRGLVLTASHDTLLPWMLDMALARGCGERPTVVVMSGCFSGIYADAPVARANRIIITAARPDRTSFGCGADYTYTYFDECLLDAIDRTPGVATWRDAFDRARACVASREQAMGAVPSEPQAVFGKAVADMALPWRQAQAMR